MGRDKMLEDLRNLLRQKKGKEFYSAKLGISVEEVDKLLRELRHLNYYNQTYGTTVESETTTSIEYNTGISEKRENIDKGTTEVKFLHTLEVLSEDEIWEETKMDRLKWKFVQIYHKKYGRGFLYTANFRIKDEKSEEVFQDRFIEFLTTFKPSPVVIKSPNLLKKPKISLIIPKQDAHFNKLDIYGDNDIEERFSINQHSILNMLKKASSVNYVEEVVYIIGSDQFNSEWTSLTTKGTPQVNILSYQEAFTEICNHEVEVINTLLTYAASVNIVFIPGNHDQFVGWHLTNWLQSYYRDNGYIYFDNSIENTKYYRYNNTAIMLNHGDAIKPKELACKFPIGFKEEWSNCDHFIILCGDKHTEMSMDFNGIKFYQVPQLSSAKSSWDDKNGYIHSKAEATAFVITETKGISDIYKDNL